MKGSRANFTYVLEIEERTGKVAPKKALGPFGSLGLYKRNLHYVFENEGQSGKLCTCSRMQGGEASCAHLFENEAQSGKFCTCVRE